MGVLKIPLKKIANNSDYEGVGIKKPTSNLPDTSTIVETVGKDVAFSIAGRLVPKLYPPLMIASLLYDVGTLGYEAYKNYMENSSKPDIDSFTDYEDEEGNINLIADLPKKVLNEIVAKKKDEVTQLKTDTDTIVSDLTAFEGTTLPEHMKNNTIFLVTAINALTNVVNSSFHELNTNLLGMGMQLSQTNDLNEQKTVQEQLARAISYLNPPANVSITTPAPTVNVAPAESVINVSSTAPTVNVAPSEAVVNVAPTLGLPVTLEDNLNDVLGLQKQSIPKQITKDDLKIESLEYTKTDKSITDLDGKVMATVSPREVANIKNVSDARWITDSNELEMEDDELDIMDLVGNIDFSDLMNHTDYGTKISEIFTTASSNE